MQDLESAAEVFVADIAKFVCDLDAFRVLVGWDGVRRMRRRTSAAQVTGGTDTAEADLFEALGEVGTAGTSGQRLECTRLAEEREHANSRGSHFGGDVFTLVLVELRKVGPECAWETVEELRALVAWPRCQLRPEATALSALTMRTEIYLEVGVVVLEKLLQSPGADALTAVLLLNADLFEVGDGRISTELAAPDAGSLGDNFASDLAVAMEQSRAEIGRFAFETEQAPHVSSSPHLRFGEETRPHSLECSSSKATKSPSSSTMSSRIMIHRRSFPSSSPLLLRISTVTSYPDRLRTRISLERMCATSCPGRMSP